MIITHTVQLSSNPLLASVKDFELTLHLWEEGEQLPTRSTTCSLTAVNAYMTPEAFRERIYEPMKNSLMRKEKSNAALKA